MTSVGYVTECYRFGSAAAAGVLVGMGVCKAEIELLRCTTRRPEAMTMPSPRSPLSLRLTPELRREIYEASRSGNTSVSEFIRAAIRAALDKPTTST